MKGYVLNISEDSGLVLFLYFCVLLNCSLCQQRLESELSRLDTADKWSVYEKYYTAKRAESEQDQNLTWWKAYLEKEGQRYNCTSWGGKTGEIKGIVFLPRSFFQDNNVRVPLRYGEGLFTEEVRLYQIERDTTNKPVEFNLRIFENCTDAQEALVGSTLTSSGHLWTIVDTTLGIGNVALSMGSADRTHLHFVRNNVGAFLVGKRLRIFKLAVKIDTIMINAPKLNPRSKFDLPAFVIMPDIVTDFQWNPGDYFIPKE